jgi:hypothetical protein
MIIHIKKMDKSKSKECPGLIDFLSFIEKEVSVWIQMFIRLLSEMNFLIIASVPSSTDFHVVYVVSTSSGSTSIMDHVSIEFVFIAESWKLEFLWDDYFGF